MRPLLSFRIPLRRVKPVRVEGNRIHLSWLRPCPKLASQEMNRQIGPGSLAKSWPLAAFYFVRCGYGLPKRTSDFSRSGQSRSERVSIFYCANLESELAMHRVGYRFTI